MEFEFFYMEIELSYMEILSHDTLPVATVPKSIATLLQSWFNECVPLGSKSGLLGCFPRVDGKSACRYNTGSWFWT